MHPPRPVPPPPGETAGVIAPPPLIYLGALALALAVERVLPTEPLPERLEVPVALALVLPGLVLLPALRAFVRARTRPEPWKPTTALVTDGPYRFTRNPMYLGFTLVYLGLAAWANSAWPVVFLPAVLGTMHFGVIRREEAYLERLFGEEYRAYCRRVRRWV